jgi:hypothetical protein
MFQYFEAARVGSWLGWIFNFGFGSILFGVSPFEITAIVFFAFSLATTVRRIERTRLSQICLLPLAE